MVLSQKEGGQDALTPYPPRWKLFSYRAYLLVK